MTTAAKSARYRIDPAMSDLTVQVFPSGLLSFMGHTPNLKAGEVCGEASFGVDGDRRGRFDVTIRSNSLHVIGDVRPGDREEIERRTREEVLETAKYFEIRFE